MRSVIVGTAGHIDHGKTSLVKALTGIDADRLAEEKRRGITIDLGFAHLALDAQGNPLPTSDTSLAAFRFGFVDVPGHERFIRNMLAGVGGIDIVMLVVAAGEGIMPQTREHFEICRLLNVKRGIVALTKCDQVDSDTLVVVRAEVEQFVRGSFLDASTSPIISVSAKTGAGLGDLRHELARAATATLIRDAATFARLPIDRAFTMKGFGTVVTGTLISGEIRKEDELELFPSGERLRVRGLQVHGDATDVARAGERVAVNLAGAGREAIERGMVLASPGVFRATARIEAQLTLLASAKPLKHGARVHLHIHTAETIAEVHLNGEGSATPPAARSAESPDDSSPSRSVASSEAKSISPGATAFAQLRLASPQLLLPEDRFIVRQFSPVITIGGGVVADAHFAGARRTRRRPDLAELADLLGPDALFTRIRRRGEAGIPLAELVAETGRRREELDHRLAIAKKEDAIVRAADSVISREAFVLLMGRALAELKTFQSRNPLATGMNIRELKERLTTHDALASAALEHLSADKKIDIAGETARLAGQGAQLSAAESTAKRTIEAAFSNAGLKVPALKEVLGSLAIDHARAHKIVTLLLREKVLLKLGDDLVFHQSALVQLRSLIGAQKTRSPRIDVATFKQLTGVSRKYAIPLLEYLDRERVTRRDGDLRIIL